jgi:O-antigen ligase
MFGIGMAQFSNFEGRTSVIQGTVGSWHETHNSWTQVSSESGVPALIFYAMGVGGAFLMVNKTYKKARSGGFKDISNVCFCYLASMVGYLVTITFLSNAYRFYVPMMIGLAVAICAAANREMSAGYGRDPATVR